MSNKTPRQASSLEKENALDMVFSSISSGGRITAEKLRGVVQDLGHDFTEEEIQEMIEVADPSGKGKVSYKSMVTMIKDNKQEFPAVPMTMEDIRRELTMIRSETTMISLKSAQARGSRAQTRNEPRMTNVNEEGQAREESDVETVSLTHRIPVDAADLDEQPSDGNNDDGEQASDGKDDNGEQASDGKTDNAKNGADDDVPGDGDARKADSGGGDDGIENGDKTARDTQEDGNNQDGNDKSKNNDEDMNEDNNNVSGQDNVDQRLGSSRTSHVVSHSLDDAAVVTALGVYGPTQENTVLEDELENVDGMKKFFKGDRDDDTQSLSVVNLGKMGKQTKPAGKQPGKVDLVRSKSMNIPNQTQSQRGVPPIKRGGRLRNNSIRHGPPPQRHSVAVVEPEPTTGLSMVQGTGIKKQPARVVHHHHHHHHYHQQTPVNNTTPRTDRDKPSGFRSAMGCALKLSQVRMRQRLLCVLWRQVYDEAMKNLDGDQTQNPAQMKKKKKVVRRRNLSLTGT